MTCTSASDLHLALEGSCSRDNLSELRRDGCLPRPATEHWACQTSHHRQTEGTSYKTWEAQEHLLYDRVRRSSISLAFFVELSMALMRDACSLQLFSSSALFSVCRRGHQTHVKHSSSCRGLHRL